MGSGLSNTQSKPLELFEYGSIQLKVDKSSYQANETITGEIYIDINKPLPDVQLLFYFEGKEAANIIKVSFDNKGKPTKNLVSDQRFITQQYSCISTWKSLESGQYVIPYSFKLPSDLPASFHQETYGYSGYVRYNLWVFLQNKSCLEIKNHINIVIRDSFKTPAKAFFEEIHTPLTTWYCLPKGYSILRVNIEKLFFNPGESARAVVEFDNSTGKLDNPQIFFSLKQKLRLLSGCTSELIYETIARQYLPGVPAGETNANYAFSISLPVFRGDDHDLDKRKCHWPAKRSQGIGTTTKSKFISSEYFLEISCPMKGCTKNSPKIICPVQINYEEPQIARVRLPAEWNPVQYENVNVVFAQEDKKQVKNIEMVKNSMIERD